jgi:predicted transcriptional regulator with HTH domain
MKTCKMTKAERAEQWAHSEAMLRKFLSEGDTVYCILRSVSRSGMRRKIDLFCIVMEEKKPRIQYLSGFASVVMGRRISQNGIIVNGCGMDMGFALVYDLSVELFGHGDALRHSWL